MMAILKSAFPRGVLSCSEERGVTYVHSPKYFSSYQASPMHLDSIPYQSYVYSNEPSSYDLVFLPYPSSRAQVDINGDNRPNAPVQSCIPVEEFDENSDEIVVDTSHPRNVERLPSPSNPPNKKDWETYRVIITRLYLDENKSLSDVKKIMEVEHEFFASYAFYIHFLQKKD